MTTARENLLKVFCREEPEWVPVVTLADGYNRPNHLPASYYQAIHSMSPSRALAEYFGVDVLDRVAGYREHYRNVGYTFTEAGDDQTEQWETPHGTVTRRVRKIRYPCGSAGEPDLTTLSRIEYPVKSVADFKAWAYVLEDVEYEFLSDDVARHVAAVGDAGIVTVNAPSSPLGMSVRVYMGIETLAIAYKEHPDELRELLEAIAESYCRCYEGIATMSGDGTINYDDTTTYAISPKMFRELEMPFLNRSADILHRAGKLYIHHACGHVLDLLPDFRQTRIDGFDGPAAPPIGNTTVAQARRGLGDGIAIMPFTEEYAMKSNDPATVRGYIRRMFQEAGSPRGFVVNIVAPPAGPVESLWLAVDEAKRLSREFF